MNNLYKRLFTGIVAFCLICAMAVPSVAFAVVNPPADTHASNYIAGYFGYIAKSGNTIQPVFSVSGTGMMEKIGATEIYLYESVDGVNYNMIKSYRYSNYSNMLAYNTSYHGGYMTYEGNANYYYKAYVCVYAGRNGGGDARYFWIY